MYENIAVLALFALIYSLLAGKVERSALSGPLVFVLFGVAAGPIGLGILDLDVGRGDLRTVADLTLAMVLFIDAANADLSVLRRRLDLPQRLLGIGLPLSIILGALAALWLFPELGIYGAAVLATMLAATDAALGKPVVANERVPAELREGLNIESGLNDGVCVPVVLLFVALALEVEMPNGTPMLALELFLREIGIGVAVGVAITCIGWLLFRYSARRFWLGSVWLQVPVAALAIACFAVAQSLHGSGYIAAFVGGLLFGSLFQRHTHGLVKAAEGAAEVFAMVTWIMFGAIAISVTWQEFTWRVFAYALLSLTVLRMIPVLIATTGCHEPLPARLFIGWFGPRGLASIVFAVIVLSYQVPGARLMALVVMCTVLLSVVLHGITATPAARALGGWYSRRDAS